MQGTRQLQPRGLVRHHPGHFSSPDHNLPSQPIIVVNSPFSHSLLPRNARVQPLQDAGRFEVIDDEGESVSGGRRGRGSTRGSTPGMQEEELHPNDHRNYITNNPHPSMQPQARPHPGAMQRANPTLQGRPVNNAAYHQAPSVARVTHNPQGPGRPPSASGQSNHGSVPRDRNVQIARPQVPAQRAPPAIPRLAHNQANTQPHQHTRQPQVLARAPVESQITQPDQRSRRESTQISDTGDAQDNSSAMSSELTFAKANHVGGQPFQAKKNVDQGANLSSALPPGFLDDDEEGEDGDDLWNDALARDLVEPQAETKQGHQGSIGTAQNPASLNAGRALNIATKTNAPPVQSIANHSVKSGNMNMHRQALQNSARGAIPNKQHQDNSPINHTSQAGDVFDSQAPSSITKKTSNLTRPASRVSTVPTPAQQKTSLPATQSLHANRHRSISPDEEEFEAMEVRENFALDDFDFGNGNGTGLDEFLDMEPDMVSKKRVREDEEEDSAPEPSSDTVEADVVEPVKAKKVSASPAAVAPPKPFMIPDSISDILKIVSAIDVKGIQLKCMEKAKKFDANMELGQARSMKSQLDDHFTRMISKLEGLAKGQAALETRDITNLAIDVGGLKDTKDKVLDGKETMTRSYADAGNQLAGQCTSLQGMTKKIEPTIKRRRIEGPSSQATNSG